MKIVYNNILPPRGFIAINLFGVLFVRKSYKEHLTPQVINHEQIHTAQMRELWYVPFYIIYFLEWLVRLGQYGFGDKVAYYNISFEEEAYHNQGDPKYLQYRKKFGQWKILWRA